jgi:hypothetical protein
MKILIFALAASLALGAGLVSGCNSTHEAGVTSDVHTQWTNVAADPKATTDAAKAVLTADGLKNVQGDSTDIDGKVTAQKADGTTITAVIKKVDTGGSQVSVTVGTFGDPTLGAEYVAKIKAKAEAH